MNSKQAKEAPNNFKITIIAELPSAYSRLRIASQDEINILTGIGCLAKTMNQGLQPESFSHGSCWHHSNPN
jgi:hypothetical protein